MFVKGGILICFNPPSAGHVSKDDNDLRFNRGDLIRDNLE